MNKAIYDALAKLSPNKAQPFDLPADGAIKDDLSKSRLETRHIPSTFPGRNEPHDNGHGNAKRR